jgi:hypothetical protein
VPPAAPARFVDHHEPPTPPVGFAWLRHSAGCFLPPAFVVSSIAPHHSKTLNSRYGAIMTEPEGCSFLDNPPQFQVRFLNPNLVVLYSAPN